MRSESVSVPDTGAARAGSTGPGGVPQIRPIYVLANLLTTVRFVVQGDSMQPNFAGDQYILVSRLTYLWDRPSRGDVVVLPASPTAGKKLHQAHRRTAGGVRPHKGTPCLHKRPKPRGAIPGWNGQPRAVRLLPKQTDLRSKRRPPCDTESIGSPDRLEGPDQEWSIGDDEYFMIGDNRANSDDSRSFGPLKRELIVGKAWIRYWPRNVWG